MNPTRSEPGLTNLSSIIQPEFPINFFQVVASAVFMGEKRDEASKLIHP